MAAANRRLRGERARPAVRAIRLRPSARTISLDKAQAARYCTIGEMDEAALKQELD
jgi:hypothetical protein